MHYGDRITSIDYHNEDIHICQGDSWNHRSVVQYALWKPLQALLHYCDFQIVIFPETQFWPQVYVCV